MMKRRDLLARSVAGGAWLALPALAHADAIDDFFLFVTLDRAEAVEKALRGGFDVNSRSRKGQVPLYVAFAEQSERVVEVLLKAPGLDVNALNAVGESPLMMAAIKGQVDAMARLMAMGAAVNKAGWTPLHYAASGGHMPAIDLLLSQGAALDALAPNGNTPLMMAAGYGTIDAAELLVRRGADVAARSQAGRSAADFAVSAGRDGLAGRLKALEKSSGAAPR